MVATVLGVSHMGAVVIHYQNWMMMMFFLRLSSILLTQEVMVDTSWRSVVIGGLTSSKTQPLLNTVYRPWILCMSMQVEMRITHTRWHVTVRFSRCLGGVSLRMKIKRCWTPSTQRSNFYEAIRGPMIVATSGQVVYLMSNCLVFGINSTPLVLPRFLERFHSGLPPR